MNQLIYKGKLDIFGGYYEETNIYIGDNEIIEILRKYEGKNLKITIEIEENF